MLELKSSGIFGNFWEDEMRKLLSIADAAQQLGVSKDTIRRMMNAGDFHIVRVRRRVMIPAEEIERICQPAQQEPQPVCAGNAR